MDDFKTRAQRVRELAELGDEIMSLAGHLNAGNPDTGERKLMIKCVPSARRADALALMAERFLQNRVAETTGGGTSRCWFKNDVSDRIQQTMPTILRTEGFDAWLGELADPRGKVASVAALFVLKLEILAI